MTPSKEKKPLPPSSSSNMTVVVLDKPSTYLQWHTALQQVKVLYLKRQYKQCASRCTQLLSTAPIEKVNQNSLSQQARPISKLIASRSTPYTTLSSTSTPPSATKPSRAQPTTSPPPNSAPSTSRTKRTKPPPLLSRDPLPAPSPLTTTTTTTTKKKETPPARAPSQTPRPRTPSRARTPPTTTTTTTTTMKTSVQHPATPPPDPLRIRKKTVHFPPTPPRSHPSPPPSSPTHSTPSAAAYNTHLISFATTLQTRIHAVETLLHRTDVAQRNGRRGAGGDVDGQGEGREARIARLRAGGWRRERFVAGRYEEVCARALAEL